MPNESEKQPLSGENPLDLTQNIPVDAPEPQQAPSESQVPNDGSMPQKPQEVAQKLPESDLTSSGASKPA